MDTPSGANFGPRPSRRYTDGERYRALTEPTGYEEEVSMHFLISKYTFLFIC